MKRHLTQLKSSEGLRQSSLTIVGNFLATGISAIAVILFSRLLGPERYGEFSVGFALVLIIIRLNDFGLNAAVLRLAPKGRVSIEKQGAYFGRTLKYKLVVSLILFTLGITITPWLQEILNYDNRTILYASFSAGLAAVYYEHLLTMLQATHRFFGAVVVNAIQASAKLIAAIALFLGGLASTSLVFILYIAAPIAPVFFSKKLLPKTLKLADNLTKPEISKLHSVASHASVAFISAGIIENIDILFVQKYLNSYETGLLGGTARIALMFNLIAYSLGNVLFPRVSRYKSKEDLKSYIKKASLISILALVGFLAFIPFSKLSIILTIGPEYLEGMRILNVLVASSFLAVASITFMALFYTLDASWYFSVSGIVQLVIIILGNGLFVPVYGLEAAAWTRLAARIALLVMTVVLGLALYWKQYERVNHA